MHQQDEFKGPSLCLVVFGFMLQLLALIVVFTSKGVDVPPGEVDPFADGMYVGIAALSTILMASSPIGVKQRLDPARVITGICCLSAVVTHFIMIFGFHISPAVLGFTVVNAIRALYMGIDDAKWHKEPIFLYSIVLHPICWIWSVPWMFNPYYLWIGIPSVLAAHIGFQQIHKNKPDSPGAGVARKWGAIIVILEAAGYLAFLPDGGAILLIMSLLPAGIHLLPPRFTVAIGFLIASLGLHPAIWAWFWFSRAVNPYTFAFASSALAVIGISYRYKFSHVPIPRGQKNAMSIFGLITGFAVIIPTFASIANILLLFFVLPPPFMLLFKPITTFEPRDLPKSVEQKYPGY